jgi:hypothetical protein
METGCSRERRGLFLGVLVASLGVVFLLNNLGVLEARQVFRIWFWPLLLIWFGLAKLIQGER